jgi:hypothetical protein
MIGVSRWQIPLNRVGGLQSNSCTIVLSPRCEKETDYEDRVAQRKSTHRKEYKMKKFRGKNGDDLNLRHGQVTDKIVDVFLPL